MFFRQLRRKWKEGRERKKEGRKAVKDLFEVFEEMTALLEKHEKEKK